MRVHEVPGTPRPFINLAEVPNGSYLVQPRGAQKRIYTFIPVGEEGVREVEVRGTPGVRWGGAQTSFSRIFVLPSGRPCWPKYDETFHDEVFARALKLLERVDVRERARDRFLRAAARNGKRTGMCYLDGVNRLDVTDPFEMDHGLCRLCGEDAGLTP